MKLSEMETEQVINVLCEATPYISNIVSDEKLLSELRETIEPAKAKNKAELLAFGAEKFTKLVPIILKRRKNDIYGVLSAVSGKSKTEISKQNIMTTLNEIRELIRDEDLMDFFKSCMASEESE